MQSDQKHMENVVKYSRWGEWAVNAAVALFVCVVIWFAIAVSLDLPNAKAELISELELSDATSTLTRAQAALGGVFYFMVDFLGIAMLLTARKLFQGFRQSGVFTTQAAANLRRIGLMILALAPVSIISQTIGNFILTLWTTGDRISINISLTDTDIYAIVIGLVITAVSQIMVEAVRISDENRAFV